VKVWELRERLAAADPDAVVAISHSPVLARICDEWWGEAPNPACVHRVDHGDNERRFVDGLPVFILEQGDPLW
jgi:hypothetical protein